MVRKIVRKVHEWAGGRGGGEQPPFILFYNQDVKSNLRNASRSDVPRMTLLLNFFWNKNSFHSQEKLEKPVEGMAEKM